MVFRGFLERFQMLSHWFGVSLFFMNARRGYVHLCHFALLIDIFKMFGCIGIPFLNLHFGHILVRNRGR